MAMEADLELPLARQTPPRPDGFIGPNSDSRANPNLSRRREKPQLSCHLCRRRKSVSPDSFGQTPVASPPHLPPLHILSRYRSLAYTLHSGTLD